MRNRQEVVWMDRTKQKKIEESMKLEVISQDPLNPISVVRKELVIGTKTVWAYMGANGKYYLNFNQIEELLESSRHSFFGFLVQLYDLRTVHNEGVESLRSLWAKGLITVHGVYYVQDESGRKYRAAELDLVAKFILDQAYNGNRLAQTINNALLAESLQIRCEAAFVGVSPNVIQVIQDINQWIACREISKSVHATFQNTCMFLKYPTAHTHNRMTKNLFGQTARQAIADNMLIGNDPSIGLDYQKEGDKLIVLANMKVKFTGYRKGTWHEKVDRAYDACID